MKHVEKPQQAVDWDYLKARGLSALSAGLVHIPPAHRWLMHKPVPINADVRWRKAANKVDHEDAWVLFKGNPASGSLPRDYRSAGIIILDRKKFDDLHARNGGECAVAYRLGAYAMVAELPNGFGLDPNNENRYAIALGIGRGILETSAGLYQPATKSFIPANGVLGSPRSVADIRQVPPEIPVV